MKKCKSIIVLLFACLCMISGCGVTNTATDSLPEPQKQFSAVSTTQSDTGEPKPEVIEETQPTEKSEDIQKEEVVVFNVNKVPTYNGTPYIAINGNIPHFTEADYTITSFETYSPLDSLGRCGVAFANIGVDIMPTEERGSIGSVKPSGWQTIKYENVDGKYLYNRCHLIGFQLSGENANVRNLITGTRSMNVDGMIPFENMVADYVKETNNHVLYRVTPIFDGNNLLATGVLIEAMSIEDNGDGICFNVFCYNEQPGIIIDHSNGDSKAEDGSAPYGSSAASTSQKQESQKQENVTTESSNATTTSYIGNKNTNKFHYTCCSSVKKMKGSNKVYLVCTRDQALAQGYSPCGSCNP